MKKEAKKISFQFDTNMIKKISAMLNSRDWLSEYSDEFSELFTICEEYNQADLLLRILDNFKIIEPNDMKKHLRKIRDKIVNDWSLSPQDTCIVCKDIEGKTDSSAAIQQLIKPQFAKLYGWSSNNNFRSDIKNVINDENIKNIVIIDDFSGTGRGLEKLCNWVAENTIHRRSKVKLYAAFIATMEETHTKKYGEVLFDIFTTFKLRKSISEGDFDNKNLDIKTMKDIERNFGLKKKNYSLGFGKSEAAIKIGDLNTANNVFPIFWDTDGVINVIFPRLTK